MIVPWLNMQYAYAILFGSLEMLSTKRRHLTFDLYILSYEFGSILIVFSVIIQNKTNSKKMGGFKCKIFYMSIVW